ncbi:aldo/keto reductase [Lacticaseibacillus yichunensis]|uniref:Aldo/keto reductase n=1 Tax=Lacticaseibacillus yichunensis TaxID=2486015 RepID=A0ABW4CQW7_9LACO|nr:aldo/keto reductase [Lacticaseibacillus yichunensis]
MQYTTLGHTGLRVSRLCLGTMNFGPRTSEEEADAIMDRALELGINFFDTANVYGGGKGGHQGWTEEIIGRWFQQGGGRREKTVLATKLYGEMHDPLMGPNDAAGVSAYKIYRSLDDSLRRLQTDHVELLQMHHIDEAINWNEVYGAFENVIAQGKTYYVGSSNFGARHLAYAKAEANNRHFLGLVAEQHKYSLLCRLPELEVLPAVRELGMGLIVWSPLAGGLLAENILHPDDDPNSRRSQAAKALSEAQRTQLEGYEALCQELGESQSTVALAWLLQNPAVTAPIIGPRTIDQLEAAVHALDVELTPDVLARLDQLFPGPGGQAPQAYAW